MKIHHLNCATMCPGSSLLVNGKGGLFSPGKMVSHCLLIETNEGLILVDTGIGLKDIEKPNKRIGRMFVKGVKPVLDPEESAYRQVQRLGFKPENVRHIVVTHLDLDHCGGIADFPNAEIHLYEKEYQTAMTLPTRAEKMRYRSIQWSHHPIWKTHQLEGDTWFGFDSVQAIHQAVPEVLLIPLNGHTRGHCGVAVKTDHRGWLLHAGDAYFHHKEIYTVHAQSTPILSLLQKYEAVDRDEWEHNQLRLRALVRDHSQEVWVFSAHDPTEFDRLQKLYP